MTPGHVFFTEDGMMDKKVFLATWKDIPPTNEFQQQINNINVPVGKTYVDRGRLATDACLLAYLIVINSFGCK